MADLKPIRIISEKEIGPEQILLAVNSITHFLNLVGATNLVPVNIHELVDLNAFYIDMPDNQRVLDGKAAMGYMIYQKYKDSGGFINILLVRGQILYEIDGQKKGLIHGLALPDKFGIIEAGWEDEKINQLNEYLLLLHELGHIYGVASKERLGTDWVEKFGRHCPGICIMSGDFTRELEKMDLINKPFCAVCLEDLKNYFKDKKVKV